MKKILLSITLGLTFIISNAQVIINDNHNSLSIGNVGTDFTGVTAGQGDYFTGGLANSEFTIASDVPTQGNVVNIIGSATATGTKFMWKNISTAWTNRTEGNNILNVEFDIFTGATTTSKNTARVYIYNSNGSTVLAGLSLNFESKALSGVAYYDPNNGGVNPIGSYFFNLGAANAVLNLTANTWVRLGISYNTATREVIWKGPGFYTGLTGAVPATGTNSPREIDYLHTAGTGNIVSVTSKFDNILVNANAIENLLGSSAFNLVASNFSVSPNPANDFITVSNSDNILVSGISITDLNGRVVKQNSYENVSNIQVNVSDLSSGVYMMNITSEKGSITKKIVKN
jgi:hypothetical protein